MLLSKPDIIYLREAGAIVIEPFKSENLGSAQYDVSLGEWLYREAKGRMSGHNIYNPFSERQVRDKWRLERAITHEEYVEHFGVALDGVDMRERLILVEPGETILGHTEEFIGGASNSVTTMMKARSSMGRNFFEVCKCAGMGDCGYFNRWTMEITNNSRYHTIPLVVGRRVAQLLFFGVTPVADEDVYSSGGKYQTSTSLEELKAAWKPEQMLPRQWNDREARAARQP